MAKKAPAIPLGALLDKIEDKRSIDLNLEDGSEPIRFLPPELWSQAALDAAEAADDEVDLALYRALFGDADWARLVEFAKGERRAVRILNTLNADRYELTNPE